MSRRHDQDNFQVLRMKTLATASLTNGAFELVDDVRGKDEGPAPHVHRQSDEAFYVIEGFLQIHEG